MLPSDAVIEQGHWIGHRPHHGMMTPLFGSILRAHCVFFVRIKERSFEDIGGSPKSSNSFGEFQRCFAAEQRIES